jgi:ferric-dicitrate binding protein FerR (iron transport regulator)
MNDELLVKYLLDEASVVERDAVDRWINAKPENKKYFNHFQLIWEASKQFVVPSTVNADDAWKRFQQRTEQASKKPAVVIQMNSGRSWIRAASIAVLIAGVAALTYFLSDRFSTPVTVASSVSPVKDTLPDGSFVTLNKNSSISYEKKFKGNQREVELKGEAFFTVTPDKKKPFVINVNDITVTVVGTSFNIKSLGNKTQVVVETGVVKVTKNHQTIELRTGEKVVADQADTAMRKEEVTDQLHKYYRTKEFVCDRTPLWKLVEVLNEAYDANIIIGNNKLRSLPLTTTFYNESLDKILSIIEQTFQISVERKDGQIILQ